MIEKIHLQNFQSHKDTTLEFSPGVNVILGQSDSGKSAIIRALEWVRTNKPGGEAFRSHWGGDTTVTVTTNDTNIKRAREKEKTGGNHYKLDDTLFKAVGKGVPEEVSTALSLDDVNVQGQHHTPFLIADTAGEVARQMNRVAQLEVIDRSLSFIQSKIRANNGTLHSLKEQQQQVTDDAGELDYLGTMRKDLIILTAIRDEFARNDSRTVTIEKAITGVGNATEAFDRTKDLSGSEKDFRELEELEKQREKTKKSKKEIENVITSVLISSKEVENYKDMLSFLESELEREMPEECPLCGTMLRK